MQFRGNRQWYSFVVRQLHDLFRLAEATALQDAEAARRLVRMARRIVMRTRVRLPAELRHRYCHRCNTLFRPGVNARVRVRTVGRGSSLVITCLVCGYQRKIVWQSSSIPKKRLRHNQQIQSKENTPK